MENMAFAIASENDPHLANWNPRRMSGDMEWLVCRAKMTMTTCVNLRPKDVDELETELFNLVRTIY